MTYEKTTGRIERFKAWRKRRVIRRIGESAPVKIEWPELTMPGRKSRTWAGNK